MSNLSNQNKTCAVVPFFNEKNSLPELVSEVEKYVDLIICVNDGSTDDSEKIIKTDEKIILINNEHNCGKGYSLRVGLQKSIELGFEKTITIDADLQHEPKFIPEFLKALDRHDLVIGNRLHDLKDMPIHRIASNKITSSMLQLKFRISVLDSQCGYRGFKNDVIESILPESNGFEAETEMIIKAFRKKLDVSFIPISTIYADEKSKMRNVQATLGFLRVFFTC